ncbi:MAG: hypothetical protein Kow0056_04470 [Coriobacteriia bacterium]
MAEEESRVSGLDDDVPGSTAGGDDPDEFRRRCETERDTMTGSETSDCAGAQVADAYENEEDGGS